MAFRTRAVLVCDADGCPAFLAGADGQTIAQVWRRGRDAGWTRDYRGRHLCAGCTAGRPHAPTSLAKLHRLGDRRKSS